MYSIECGYRDLTLSYQLFIEYIYSCIFHNILEELVDLQKIQKVFFGGNWFLDVSPSLST